MSAELAHRFTDRRSSRARLHSRRALVVAALGPLTVLGGIVWAVVQSYRVTLLHPAGQGFWWLVSEPPLFVVLAGVAFHLLVAGPLIRDLQEHEEEAGG